MLLFLLGDVKCSTQSPQCSWETSDVWFGAVIAAQATPVRMKSPAIILDVEGRETGWSNASVKK